MAFAPYTNDKIPEGFGFILGGFRPGGKFSFFEYAERPASNEAFSDYPHIVFVNPRPTLNDYRYARVLKTVAHVVVDEDENGKPVVEKWKLSQHHRYSQP